LFNLDFESLISDREYANYYRLLTLLWPIFMCTFI